MTFINATMLKTLERAPTAYTPVWIMRQAGRYLPEYQKTRAQAGSFLKLCKTPELACEVTLQPLARYPLDAAILFSDILTIPDAMGLGLNFIEGEGPHFYTKISTIDQVNDLRIPNPEEDLGYVMSAIRLIKAELQQKIPLIGFAGSPFTLAAYMLEGGSSKNFSIVKDAIINGQEILLPLLEKLTKAVISYLNAQINAGADIVMIFDSWGGLIDDAHYKSMSLHYIDLVLKGLNTNGIKKVPTIVFARGASSRLNQLQSLTTTALGLDQETDLLAARHLLTDKFVLQGNFDPQLLKSSDTLIKKKVAEILNTMRDAPHIFNLGHGITPDIEPEKLGFLINEVHEQSQR